MVDRFDRSREEMWRYLAIRPRRVAAAVAAAVRSFHRRSNVRWISALIA